MQRLDKRFIDTLWAFIKAGHYKCATRKDRDGQTTFLSNLLGYVFERSEVSSFDNGATIEIR